MREMIAQAYPDHGVLGEEYGDDRPGADYRWVLDPIDGTKAFVSGTYLFGTLIALLKQGRPVLGIIHQPIVGDLLVGTRDATWLNDRPVRVSPCDRVEDAILLATDHWNVFNHQDGAAFEALTRRARRYNNWGDCHGYFLVATGGAHIMMDPDHEPVGPPGAHPGHRGRRRPHHRLARRRPGRRRQRRGHEWDAARDGDRGLEQPEQGITPHGPPCPHQPK